MEGSLVAHFIEPPPDACSTCWNFCPCDNSNIFECNPHVRFSDMGALLYLIPLRDVLASAASGCPYCDLLHAVALHFGDYPGLEGIENTPEDIDGCLQLRYTGPLHFGERRPTLIICVSEVVVPGPILDSSHSVRRLKLFAVPSAHGPGAHATERLISASALNPACTSLMLQWLRDCQKQHSVCTLQSASVLPTRLVQLRQDGTQHVYISHPGERGDYAALSHRWGSAHPLLALTTNIALLVSNIKWDELPKSFQDAISVCRALEIQYLWIDSLCILQDSKEDWAAEATKMRDVYSGAAFTLFADCARDSDAGFLQGGRWRSQGVHRSLPSANGGLPVEVCVRQDRAFRTVPLPHHRNPDSPESCLAERGWILQETYLSPRSIYFTSDELVWVCRTKSLCECSTLEQHSLMTTLGDSTDFRERWEWLLADYNQRKLTYSSDRLVAIAGLARSLHKDTDAEYWAGLWSDNIPGALFWFQAGPPDRGLSQRVKPYHAPSWSWASVTGQVVSSRIQLDGQYHAQFEAEYAGPDVYGALLSAKLHITASLLEMTVLELQRPLEANNVQFPCHANDVQTYGGQAPSVLLDVQGNDLADLEVQPGDRIWAVCWKDMPTTYYDENRRMLAVRESHLHQGSYERVGLIFFPEDNPSVFEEWLAAAEEGTIILV